MFCRFFKKSEYEALATESNLEAQSNQVNTNNVCSKEKVFNRGKVIFGSLTTSMMGAMLTKTYLLDDALEEPYRTISTTGIGLALFMVVLPLTWRYAPCMLVERYEEQERQKKASNDPYLETVNIQEEDKEENAKVNTNSSLRV